MEISVRGGFALTWLLLGTLLWAMPVHTVVAADDYLSTLEDEASDTGQRTAAASAPATGTQAQDRQLIRAGLGFEEFETELKSAYAGTWFLYARLSEPQRKAVFGAYQNDNRTTSVRDEIVKQLSRG
jgi:hypothetical protein